MVQQEADEGNRILYLPIVLQAAGRQAEADERCKAASQVLGRHGRVLRRPTAMHIAAITTWRSNGLKERTSKRSWLGRNHRRASVEDPGQRPALQGLPAQDEPAGVAPQSAALTAASPT